MSVYRRVPGEKSKKNKHSFPPPTPFFALSLETYRQAVSVDTKYSEFCEGSVA